MTASSLDLLLQLWKSELVLTAVVQHHCIDWFPNSCVCTLKQGLQLSLEMKVTEKGTYIFFNDHYNSFQRLRADCVTVRV